MKFVPKIKLNTFYNMDCLRLMDIMRKQGFKCDLVLTSPPYNTGKNCKTKRTLLNRESRYDIYIENKTSDEYIDWTIKVFKMIDKVLKDKGVILYNLSYSTDTTQYKIQDLSTYWKLLSKICEDTPFIIVDKFVWKKSSALPNNTSPNKMTRITEDIFVITRKVNAKNFICNKQVKSVRKDTGQKYYENLFNFIEAKNNDGACQLNKATYSTELCIKLLKIYASQNCIVYDPFMGTGTTAVACKQLGMKFIGSEISENQVEYSKDRLNNV